MKYDDYLQTDHWKATRLRKMESQNWTCEQCGGRAEQVHHLHYRTKWHESNNDLKALCHDCHYGTHFSTPEAEQERIALEQERIAAAMGLSPVAA